MYAILSTIFFYAMTASTLYGFDQSHAVWNQLTGKHVNKDGLVNYNAFGKDRVVLAKYLNELQQVEYGKFNMWRQNDKKAFLINAYNAFTVDLILEHYANGKLDGIKTVGTSVMGVLVSSPWNKKFFKLLPYQDGSTVAYKMETLDNVEHDFLRANFPDYRIHAAVNCAAISCPKLRNEAYVGNKLDAQLDEQMSMWLAAPGKNYYKADGNEIYVSMIFKWYSEDFTPVGGVNGTFEKHGPSHLREALKKGAAIKYAEYNWLLNKQ